MAGWSVLQVLRKFEVDVFHLGLEIAPPAGMAETVHTIELVPRDDCLPVYTRDATVFHGTIEEAIIWIQGLTWAREYDDMIKVSSEKTREKAEQKERNRQLMHAIKTGVKPDGRVIEPAEDDDEDFPF